MKQTALSVFASLVGAAERREPLTYEDLAEQADVAKPQLYVALTEVREFCRARNLPMINVLAVNAQTRVPGSGFVKGLGIGKFDKPAQRTLFEQQFELAITHHWRDLLRELGLEVSDEDPAAGLSDELEPYFEGARVELARHFQRERSHELVRRAVERWRALGQLRCEACGFDFAATYGTHGADFIEAHHHLPLSQLPAEGGVTRPTDLAPVCANCHRMIHRADPPLKVAEVADLIARNRRPE